MEPKCCSISSSVKSEFIPDTNIVSTCITRLSPPEKAKIRLELSIKT